MIMLQHWMFEGSSDNINFFVLSRARYKEESGLFIPTDLLYIVLHSYLLGIVLGIRKFNQINQPYARIFLDGIGFPPLPGVNGILEPIENNPNSLHLTRVLVVFENVMMDFSSSFVVAHDLGDPRTRIFSSIPQQIILGEWEKTKHDDRVV